MNKINARRGRLAAVAFLGFMVAAMVAISPSLHRGSALAADATNPPTTAPSMTMEQLEQDLQAASQDFSQSMKSPQELLDPEFRKANGPKMIPVLKRLDSDTSRLAKLDPRMAGQMAGSQLSVESMLALLDDSQTNADLKKAAAGTGDDAIRGKSALLVADWLRNNKDAAAQDKMVATLKGMAKDNPQSDLLAAAAIMMSELGAASSAQSDAVGKIILNDLKSPMAQMMATQLAAAEKMRAIEGKPLVIAGALVDGKNFTTADWKGKVILVDFWATWCVPCKEELPRVTKVYADFHAKGLEVLGVSNDYKGADLTKFVAARTDMPWPQLFDAAAAAKNQWNPITQGFGIDGIPTMFLIDKKGICRTVEARANFEEMIPKMLAESAD